MRFVPSSSCSSKLAVFALSAKCATRHSTTNVRFGAAPMVVVKMPCVVGGGPTWPGGGVPFPHVPGTGTVAVAVTVTVAVGLGTARVGRSVGLGVAIVGTRVGLGVAIAGMGVRLGASVRGTGVGVSNGGMRPTVGEDVTTAQSSAAAGSLAALGGLARPRR